MKRTYVIFLVLLVILAVRPGHAGEWTEVGPASMPLSDWTTLQQMVGGIKPIQPGPRRQNQDTREVDIGIALMPQSHWDALIRMVNGDTDMARTSRNRTTQVFDAGLFTMEEQQWNALVQMVREGPLGDRLGRKPAKIASH